jgi:hypothetical protein
MSAENGFERRTDALRWPEKEGGQKQVDDPKPDIAGPPAQRGKLASPPRPAEFPGRDEEQATEDDDSVQWRLLSLSALPAAGRSGTTR